MVVDNPLNKFDPAQHSLMIGLPKSETCQWFWLQTTPHSGREIVFFILYIKHGSLCMYIFGYAIWNTCKWRNGVWHHQYSGEVSSFDLIAHASAAKLSFCQWKNSCTMLYKYIYIYLWIYHIRASVPPCTANSIQELYQPAQENRSFFANKNKMPASPCWHWCNDQLQNPWPLPKLSHWCRPRKLVDQ